MGIVKSEQAKKDDYDVMKMMMMIMKIMKVDSSML
jgi:hypothetical protein